MNTKQVFSKKIAIQLREQGFPILRTEVNKKYPKYDVYIFEATDEFLKAFSSLRK